MLALIYVIFGGWLGFALAAILCAAGRADEEAEKIERRAEARQGGDQS